MGTRAPVPVAGDTRDPERIGKRADMANQGRVPMALTEAHHALLDNAEDMKGRGAKSFTANQVGAKAGTADALVDAGLLQSEEAMGGAHFPNAGKVYRLTY